MSVELEAMWATSGTGEEFRCLHIDDALEIEAALIETTVKLRNLEAVIRAALDDLESNNEASAHLILKNAMKRE